MTTELARLTAELTARCGATLPDTEPPHWREASADAIAHFARAYGDDNPIFIDPEAARAGPRGRLMAPPLFPLATGAPSADPAGWPGPFGGTPDPGIDAERWVLHRPVAQGARLARRKRLGPVQPWPRAGEPVASYTVVERTDYTERDQPVATRDRRRRFWLGAAPHPAPTSTSHSVSTTDVMARLEAAYAAERRRGARLRLAHDVGVGDPVGPMVKGPLTVTDLIGYRAGVGPGPLGGEPLRLAWRNRQERPGLYDVDRHGYFDIIERRHWDDEYARSLGLPGAYDYSHTRLLWLSHLVTDWMGDGGHLYELSGTTALAPNYTGDTHWLDGQVTKVTPEPWGRVDLSLRGTNQHGVVTCRATATVLLPAAGAVLVGDLDLEAFDRSTTALATDEFVDAV